MKILEASRHRAARRARRVGITTALLGSLVSTALLVSGFLVTRGEAVTGADPSAMLLRFLGLSLVVFGILFVAFGLLVGLPAALARRGRR